MAQLAHGWLVMPGTGRQRFSLLHVDDLAALLVTLVAGPFPRDRVLEPDDGTEGGYSWRELADCAARSRGRPVRPIPVPRAVFTGLAVTAEGAAWLTGGPPRLARGKVAELFHADWLCDPASLNGIDWAASHRFADGFGRTIAWYRQAGWLAA
jgi:nucleoside-diphosphate-sugar epimerase